MSPILSFLFHYSLHGGFNAWLGLFKVLSDRFLFSVLRDRFLFRVAGDRVLFRVLSSRVIFRASVGSSSWSLVLVLWHVVCHQLHQQLEGFTMIFCFKHFNSNRFFDNFVGKFDAIKFLKKGFILHFWLGSEYTYAESFIFRSIHPRVLRKIAFLKDFSKFLETFPWLSTFQRSYRSKIGLLHGCYLVKQLFWCFLNSYIRDYLRFFNTPVTPHSNYTFTTT